MLALAHSAAMQSIDGYVVRVEADRAAGTGGFSLIGLPDSALGEARDRVRAALINSGYRFQADKVLVNLAPAEIHKISQGFDLAIALALLAIEEWVDTLALLRFIALGELALDGTVRATRGVLPMAIAASNSGFDALVVPRANAEQAALGKGLHRHALDAIALGNGEKYRHVATKRSYRSRPEAGGDFADIGGQTVSIVGACARLVTDAFCEVNPLYASLGSTTEGCSVASPFQTNAEFKRPTRAITGGDLLRWSIGGTPDLSP